MHFQMAVHDVSDPCEVPLGVSSVVEHCNEVVDLEIAEMDLLIVIDVDTRASTGKSMVLPCHLLTFMMERVNLRPV